MVRHDGTKLLLQLGRFALESLPVNFALLTTRSMCGWSSDGAVAITKPRSLSCPGISLWSSFPSRHWLISEGWNKNAACPSCVVHVQSLTNFYQNEAILFKWQVRGEEVGFDVEQKGMLHLFPDLLGLRPLFPCSPWVCLAGRLEVLAHIAFFSHWVQQRRQVFGNFFFLCNVASSQENTIDIFLLSSSSHQAPLWLLCPGHKMPWQYLIKSLQNCLITVLNVRCLCNLNIRYKF